jgi:hypothetical protein
MHDQHYQRTTGGEWQGWSKADGQGRRKWAGQNGQWQGGLIFRQVNNGSRFNKEGIYDKNE